MFVTRKQALKAVNIISELIHDAFPPGARYTATQINIHPSWTKVMYDLVKEIESNCDNKSPTPEQGEHENDPEQ